MRKISNFSLLGLMTLVFAGFTVLSGCGNDEPVKRVVYEATLKKDGVTLRKGKVTLKVKMWFTEYGIYQEKEFEGNIDSDGTMSISQSLVPNTTMMDFSIETVTASAAGSDGTLYVASEQLDSEKLESEVLRRKGTFNFHKSGAIDGSDEFIGSVKGLLRKFNRGDALKDVSREAVSSRHENGRLDSQDSLPSSKSSSAAAI